VTKVVYEVYSNYSAAWNETHYTEFVVVHFVGGGKSVRTISGNSNNANFIEVGKLINGGYYDELDYYNKVKSNATFVEV
jgi:thioredoxin-related protein